MGVLLAGLDRRFKTYILSVCDGGQVIHFAGTGPMDEVFRSLPAEEQKRWVAAMAPIESIRFIHLDDPAKLFFQFGN